jgi:hypothetical protein
MIHLRFRQRVTFKTVLLFLASIQDILRRYLTTHLITNLLIGMPLL